MEPRASRAAILVAAMVVALIGPSCTGSDPIASGRGNLALRITSSPSTTYAWAQFKIPTLTFRPTSPESNAAQSDNLTLLPTAFTVDLNNTTDAVASSVLVTSQQYAIQPFDIDTFELNVDPVDPSAAGLGTTCSGSTVTVLRVAASVHLVPTCLLTVPASGEAAIRLTIDGEGFANLLASKVNCADPGTYEPPTEAEILAFLSFDCGP